MIECRHISLRNHNTICIVKNIFYAIIFLFIYLLSPYTIEAHTDIPHFVFYPKVVSQGEPLMLQVDDLGSFSVKKITFGGVPVSIFKYQAKPTGLVGIDLQKKPGVYVVRLELSNGEFVFDSIEVKKKTVKVAPYNIPTKLGGNSLESQKKLIDTLAEENSIFKNIKTSKKRFWISGFVSPLTNPVVIDEFGYLRKISSFVMTHKGVDYLAKEGTKVMATNDGIVRVVGDYRNYGKTIIIDHGLGVLSFYLHLSETKVKKGDFVLAGQEIGLSGQTGYAESPHLHFSIRIYGVSVDPVKFLELFK